MDTITSMIRWCLWTMRRLIFFPLWILFFMESRCKDKANKRFLNALIEIVGLIWIIILVMGGALLFLSWVDSIS